MPNMTGPDGSRADILQLRFQDDEGNLTELNAAHVAEVLQGLVGLANDFAKAGAFGDGVPGDIRVRPPREGSFILEVVNWIEAHPVLDTVAGSPTLATIVAWCTKSLRAEVSGVDYLDNGNVLVHWQDNTVQEVPTQAWAELNKRKRRRKKQLREILAPLSDRNVTTAEVRDGGHEGEVEASAPLVVLERTDYRLAAPEDEVSEASEIFETEAQMVTVDFDSGEKWRVRTRQRTKVARLDDEEFLSRVQQGLALHKTDIFNVRIREDRTVKNGRASSKWTVIKVVNHRRASGDE